MNGHGFGSPPWGPAEPVPELEETNAIPGLGPVSGPGQLPRRSPAAARHRAGHAGHGTFPPSAASGQQANGSAAGPSSNTAVSAAATTTAASAGGAGDEQDQHQPKHGKRGAGGKRRRSFWRELPVLILVALVLALVIKSFAVQAFYIPSGSMQNTLEINDRVLINKIVYHLRPIHRGDIIVFDGTGSWDFNKPPGSSNIFAKAVSELEGLVGVSQDSSIYIKRVIGLPGDHVACCNAAGQVTVNGVPLSEASYLYPHNKPSGQKFTITVPAGRLWVMGDHRQISDDSRGHTGDPGGGTIPETGVLGRAFVIIWPPSRWGILNIPATFEQPRLNAATAAGGNAAAGGSSATLAAAMATGTPVSQADSPVPLALGFIGAVPITWLNRKLRSRHRKP